MQPNWKSLALAMAGAVGLTMAAPSFGWEDQWQAAATGNSFSQSTAPVTVMARDLVVTGRPVVVLDAATNAPTQVIAVEASPVVTSRLNTVVLPSTSVVTVYRPAYYNSSAYDDWMNGNIRSEFLPRTTVTRVAPVTHQVYVDDLGQRFIALNVVERGLTPAEASRLYGNVDSSAGPTLTGTGVQPGNMGPGNAKGQ